LEGSVAGDVEDGSFAHIGHALQIGGGEVGECADVERDLVADACGVGFGEVAEGAEPGVVDQDVDAQATTVGLGDHLVGRTGDREVRGDDLGSDLMPRRQLACERYQLVLTACDEDQIGAAGGEDACELLADTSARSGDQCCAVAVLHVRPRRRRSPTCRGPCWRG